jgi:glycosyltransferase involved in cell wall biosynthesis
MEQNTPILSSFKGSLEEVGGEHAHYFDPADHKGFVVILKDLLKNKSKREQYVSNAKVWAHSFTWERVVEGTHTVYEKVLG